MALSKHEKELRARQRMIEKAREYTLGTYSRQVAQIFQKMIRAEYAAKPNGIILAMVNGELTSVSRRVGECVCITCGKVAPWKGALDRFGGMHTGHFLASRCNAILFEEDNVAPQCSHCNVYKDGSPQEFRIWMNAVRGKEVVQRLEELKRSTRHFEREELVDMKIAYTSRLKAAEERVNIHRIN